MIIQYIHQLVNITPNSDFQIANKKYIDDSISALVSSAPSTLNTLNELSAALGNDPNFSTTLTTSLGAKAGLSSNSTFTGNNTFSGNDLFSGTNTITGNLIANAITITPSTLSNIQWLDISSSLTTLLSNKLSTATASTTYQPILTSSSNILTNTITSSGLISANGICEKLISVSGTNSYTLNYSSGNCYYIAQDHNQPLILQFH